MVEFIFHCILVNRYSHVQRHNNAFQTYNMICYVIVYSFKKIREWSNIT